MPQGLPAPIFGASAGLVDSSVVGTVHAGAPAYQESSTTIAKSSNSTATLARAVGLLTRASAKNEVAALTTNGPLVLEVSQWNLVIADESPDGLVPGKQYFVGATAGTITDSAPGSNKQGVGFALSQTTMLVGFSAPNGVE